jgi:hypothetical protein
MRIRRPRRKMNLYASAPASFRSVGPALASRPALALTPYSKRFTRGVGADSEAVEMPDRVAENLVLYIRQNNGTLSQKRRQGEFHVLHDDEVKLIEGIVNDVFEGF